MVVTGSTSFSSASSAPKPSDSSNRTLPRRRHMSRRTVLPRRIFLRGMLAGGVSVAVPVPRLIGMLNDNGTAYAAGGALPVRFGTWFFGNRIIPELWVPTNTGVGDNWTLSDELAPLQDVKPW